MRNRQRFLSAVLATALLVLAAPAAALAATTSARADIWGSGASSVLDLDMGREPTYVVSLVLAEEFSEPPDFPVAVPIPEGATVIWAGEIVSNDPAQDITARNIDITEVDGQRCAVFRMTKSNRVQVECSVPEEVLSGDQNRREIKLEWRAPSAMTAMQMAVVAPPNYKADKVPEGVKQVSIQSGTAYIEELKDLEQGEDNELELAIVPGNPEIETTGSAPATGIVDGLEGGDGNTTEILLAVLGGALLLTVAVLVVVWRRERSRGAAAASDGVGDPEQPVDDADLADEPDGDLGDDEDELTETGEDESR